MENWEKFLIPSTVGLPRVSGLGRYGRPPRFPKSRGIHRIFFAGTGALHRPRRHRRGQAQVQTDVSTRRRNSPLVRLLPPPASTRAVYRKTPRMLLDTCPLRPPPARYSLRGLVPHPSFLLVVEPKNRG